MVRTLSTLEALTDDAAAPVEDLLKRFCGDIGMEPRVTWPVWVAVLK